MGLTHTQAQAHAPAMTYYLQKIDPTIHIGTVISQLKKTPSNDPLTIITAAWQTIHLMHQGHDIPFSHLTQQTAQLHTNTAYPNPTPTNHHYRPKQTRSHQPINTRHETECPTHPGQRANHCSGCRADQLAGHPGTQQPLPHP